MASQFDDAMEYLVSIVVSKIYKGKKKDKIGLVRFHDYLTGNPMYDRAPDTWLNCVISPPKPYDWEATIELLEKCQVNSAPIAKEEVDLPRSLAVALQHIQDTAGQPKRVTKTTTRYSMILVSDMKSKSDWKGLVDPIVQLIKAFDVLLGVVYLPGEGDAVDENLAYFKEIVGKLNLSGGRTANSFVSPLQEAKEYVRDWQKEPPKLVMPTGVFRGQIRLCCDINSIDMRNTANDLRNAELDAKVPEPRTVPDAVSLSFFAEGYPLTKEETVTMTQEVGIKDGETFPISQVREHFVYEKDDGEDAVTKPVQPNEIQKGYRYGTSIIPTTPALQRQLEMPTYSGIDILYFAHKKSIPPWYYRGESILLIPNKEAASKDLVALSTIAQSMLYNKTVAIARVVQRPNRPVTIAALLPRILVTQNTKFKDQKRSLDDDDDKRYYALTMVKLFFKDDEKIPMLSKLTPDPSKEKDEEVYPSKEMCKTMDAFVDSLDLDKLNGVTHTDEQGFVELNYFDSLPVPWYKGIQEQSVPPTFDAVTRKMLSLNSPKLHYIPKAMRAIYQYFVGLGREQDTLFGMVEKASASDKPFFDTFFEELKGKTVVDGESTFIPRLYDTGKLDPNFAKLLQHMKEIYQVEKVVPKEPAPAPEEEVQVEPLDLAEILK